MMDWNALHTKVRGALPAVELPAKRYWIAVLIHDRSPEQHLQERDFVWMMAHAKITVAKIHATYLSKHPDADVELKFKDETVEPTVVVRELNHHGDNVVVFRAVKKKTRAPLTPVHRKIKAEPPRSHSDSVKSTANSSTHPSPAFGPISNGTERMSATDSSVVPLPTAISVNNENSPGLPWLSAQQVAPREPVDDLHQAIPEQNSKDALRKAQTDGNNSDLRHWDQPAVFPLERDRSVHTPLRAPPVPLLSRSSPAQPPTLPTQRSPVKAERESPRYFQSSARKPLESFNPDDVFNRDPSPEGEAEARPTDVYIRQVIDQQNPEALEAGVGRALKVLDTLKGSFSQYAQYSPDADVWVKAIDKLKTQAKRKRTVVGVVGNTGAGKSSVINAMLDEERLVPTNCMRACTAVVTEMSWNDSRVPNRKYRAEIEFVAHADWEKELSILLKDFLTENGTLSKEAYDQNSDAGIAWAKFHAVYPKETKDRLGSCTVTSLMAEKSVLDVLGTTKKINQPRAESFYRELQKYVDSKEKVTKKGKNKDKDNQTSKFQMEYWPLIKVVKIYVKSPALSTGAVIVDLPGVHDSNAARAAVAQGYMKQCTGLWIVAPINRAVDDKAAKTLLGDSFKRQLKYDGGFSSVTFICSKTDDISITEATESLDLDDQISELDDQERDYKKQIKDLQDKISELQESKVIYKGVTNEADDDLETWETLKDDFNEGQTVYAPIKKDNKRKRGGSGKKARKRYQAEEDDDDDFVVSDDEISDELDSESDAEGIQAPQKPLTEKDIKARLDELRNTKKNARREHAKIEANMKEIRPKMAEIRLKSANVRAEIRAICIAGRNNYSKTAIQQDFAAGIRELDQENAAEEDEENFNPDEELRDYEEVARSLPVFCVSSRAYQKMCGRLQKDDAVPGFKTPEETEMPQLQAHCKKLTEAGRIQTCRKFLLSLCSQLNNFSFWAWSDGSGLKMTDDENHKQMHYLQKRLGELQKGLENAIQACVNSMKREISEQILDKYPELIDEAVNAAPSVARGWGAPVLEGGLYWGTYKALVRRDGIYTSATAGHRDFNAELIDPITKRLATGWERTFQNRLPKAFELYTKDSGKVLHKFHEMVEERARQNGVGIADFALLHNQIHTYEQLFNELNGTLVNSMTELQRNANRDFTPTIVNIMHIVYDICADERGRGSFMRMKANMDDYVEGTRHHMFKDATQTVAGHLNQMCRDLEEIMANKADEIFMSMRGDYTRVLGGTQVNRDTMLSVDESTMRAEIKSLLLGIDEQFRAIVNGEIELSVDEEKDDTANVESADETGNIDDDETESVFEDYVEDPESARDDSEDAIHEDAAIAETDSDVEMNDEEETYEKL